MPGPGQGISVPAATHSVGTRDSRWPRNNDPFLREWVHLQGGLAPAQALVAGCLRLTYQLTLTGVAQPPSGKGAGGHWGSWGPEGEQGRGASLSALGPLGLCHPGG